MHSIESKAFQVELHIDPKRMDFILNSSGFIFNFLLCIWQRYKPRSAYLLPNLLTCLPLKLMATAKNFKILQPNIFYIYHSKNALNLLLKQSNQKNSIPVALRTELFCLANFSQNLRVEITDRWSSLSFTKSIVFHPKVKL